MQCGEANQATNPEDVESHHTPHWVTQWHSWGCLSFHETSILWWK